MHSSQNPALLGQKSKDLSKGIDWLQCLILALGFVLLFLFLDWKPPQHDEGVNGWIIQDVISKGYYAYDPANYHGPLHFYLLFIFKIIFGDNLWALRLSAVLFGWASIYVMMALSPYVGRFTAYAAALLMAVSPGMTFYSRYAIHESGLLFFSLLMLLGFFRYIAEKDLKSVIFLSAGFTGMLAMKETLVIHLVCFVGAYYALKLYEKISPSEPQAAASARRFEIREALRVVGICFIVTLMLYTGFFMNWKGFFGIFKSFAEWANTGALPTSEQKGHWKPFIYWVQLFLRYEWPAALGFLVCFPLLAACPRWHRLLMFYGVAVLLVYSAIPYKTPWCILQMIWPFLFITSAGLAALASRGGKVKILALGLLLALAGISLSKTISLNFFHYSDDRELYPHVQTFEDLMNIDRKVKDFVKKHPLQKHMSIEVVKKAYWPISWLFLDFTHQSYYTDEYPPKADADLIFCDVERRPRLEMRLKNSYFVEKFRLNPSQDPGAVYYNTRVFGELFGPGAERFEPKPMEPAKEGEGLSARYYSNADWTGEAAREEKISGIDFGWDDSDRPLPAPFGIVMEGELFIPESGEFSFYLASDDGSQFFVGDDLVIDNSGNHVDTLKSAVRKMEEGWHPVKIRYFDVGGAASVRLWWKRPGGTEEKIDARFFRPRNT